MKIFILVFYFVFISVIQYCQCSCRSWPERNFFGPDCTLLCHCANKSEKCDEVTGNCASGCAREWMGPGCQYKNLALALEGDPRQSKSSNNQHAGNAIDENISSCSNAVQKGVEPAWWRVSFKTPQYISGVKFWTSKEHIDQFQSFRVLISNSSWEDRDNKKVNPEGINCFSHSGNQDIVSPFIAMCDTPILGNQVRIVMNNTKSRLVLCDVRLYGGRNLAIGKPVRTSNVDGDIAGIKLSTDGVLKRGSDKKCLRLSSGVKEQWWQISFPRLHLVHGITVESHVYVNLSNVLAQTKRQDNDSWSNLTPLYVSKDVMQGYFVPTEFSEFRLLRNESSISQAIEKRLVLCEVQIWGDCNSNDCGFDCSTPCFCNHGYTQTKEDKMAAICKHGCEPGWTGEGKRCDKSKCTDGNWGEKCNRTCGNCLNGTICRKTDGQCEKGCAAGWEGNLCSEECTDGNWGEKCNGTCGICLNGTICRKTDGQCKKGCAAGWEGNLCSDMCAGGNWGEKCNKTCGNCLNGTICRKTDGQCEKGCAAGWEGNLCSHKCTDGNWGEKCSRSCGNCLNGTICRKTDGECESGCAAGWEGNLCSDKCTDGNWGEKCNRTCGNCLNGTICRKTDGQCEKGCAAGWEGNLCSEECTDGNWGEKCNRTCGNCLNGTICRKTDGQCEKGCAAGWEGNLCSEVCAGGNWGEKCNKTCGNCLNGTICRKTDGQCEKGCAAGWEGNLCSHKCTDGNWGEKCSRICGNCLNGTICRKTDGQCEKGCAAGWEGNLCSDKCTDGNWGEKCNRTCGNCLNGTICRKTDGQCEKGCAAGWEGNLCSEECTDGNWGEKCNRTCGNCLNGTICRKTDGQCKKGCAAGWEGNLCSDICADGNWGEKCNRICGNCLHGTICRKTDGQCEKGCAAGWKGNVCSHKCTDGYWGEKCNRTCGNCLNGTICRKTDGQCEEGCAAGWEGNLCSDMCTDGNWGEKCNRTCGNCLNGTICRKTDGQCEKGCAAGWEGKLCSDNCAEGYWGEKCNRTCRNCLHGTVCRKTDGHCKQGCNAGWQGNLCSEMVLENGTKFSLGVLGAISAGTVIFIGVLVAALFIILNKVKKWKNNSNQAVSEDRQCRRISNDAAERELDGDRHSEVIELQPREVEFRSTPEAEQLVYANAGPHVALDDIHCIKVSDLERFMKTTTPEQLFEEFKSLPYGLIHPAEAASTLENRPKNRYLKMYPYDHSRVKLKTGSKASNSDYINASFIQGFDKAKAYIAASAPIDRSVDDFWQMIWEQEVESIVMVTNLIEAEKVKCLKYWPDANSVHAYNRLNVETDVETEFADFTVRSFLVSNVDEKKQREIHHYHFTGWPDKDVPDGSTGLVHFLQTVRNKSGTSRSPWLVHCSAGVGRTGTFIALDLLFAQGKQTGTINVYQCVYDLRQQRVNMVQTKEQYKFIHEALFELFVLPCQPVKTYSFDKLYRRLLQKDPEANITKLKLQYQLLEANRHSKYWSDNQKEDIKVCRPHDDIQTCLATDGIQNCHQNEISGGEHCAALSPADENHSGFRNNVLYIPSFTSQTGYITCQHPTERTVKKFIQLILQEDTRFIVALDSYTDWRKSMRTDYLPTDGSAMIGPYRVEANSVHETGYYTLRHYVIKDGNHEVRTSFMTYKGWLQKHTIPTSVNEMVGLIRYLGKQQSSAVQPILVLCLDGFTKSGLFCVLLSTIERMKAEEEVAIAQVMRKARLKNPKIITCFEQFKFCHDFVQLYLQSEETYANVL